MLKGMQDISLPRGSAVIEINRWFAPGSSDPAGALVDLESPVYYAGKFIQKGNFPLSWVFVEDSVEFAYKVDAEEAQKWVLQHPWYNARVLVNGK